VSLEFFGQFLLRQGELDEADLRQALTLMEELNQNVGDLAVQEDFATEADCRRVNDEQKRTDLPFGELAMQMGILNQVELEELLQIQQRIRVDLVKAVVELGHLSDLRVRVLHDQWKSEQEAEPSGTNTLPPGLRGIRTAEVTANLFDRMCRRVADLNVKVGPGRALEGLPDMVLVASLDVTGSQPLRITLMGDGPFGEQLAKGLLGMQLDALAAELALEGIGEFLNVLMGNVVSTLGEEALDLRLTPPRYGVLPRDGFGFEVVTEAQGTALIVLESLA
jgi:hypothetical protein